MRERVLTVRGGNHDGGQSGMDDGLAKAITAREAPPVPCSMNARVGVLTG